MGRAAWPQVVTAAWAWERLLRAGALLLPHTPQGTSGDRFSIWEVRDPRSPWSTPSNTCCPEDLCRARAFGLALPQDPLSGGWKKLGQGQEAPGEASAALPL